MNLTPNSIFEAAVKLPEADRLALVLRLMDTLPAEVDLLSMDDPNLLDELDRRASDDSGAAAFVAHWARLGPILAKVTRQEQSQFTEEEHLQAVANVLEIAQPDLIPSETSGLVEQQRLFSKFFRNPNR